MAWLEGLARRGFSLKPAHGARVKARRPHACMHRWRAVRTICPGVPLPPALAPCLRGDVPGENTLSRWCSPSTHTRCLPSSVRGCERLGTGAAAAGIVTWLPSLAIARGDKWALWAVISVAALVGIRSEARLGHAMMMTVDDVVYWYLIQ